MKKCMPMRLKLIYGRAVEFQLGCLLLRGGLLRLFAAARVQVRSEVEVGKEERYDHAVAEIRDREALREATIRRENVHNRVEHDGEKLNLQRQER
jgi:hypothetical protein